MKHHLASPLLTTSSKYHFLKIFSYLPKGLGHLDHGFDLHIGFSLNHPENVAIRHFH
jgi:hypothetical protein